MTRVAKLTWKIGDKHNEIEVKAGEMSIGRAPTCDIVLPEDQMVSRRHAIIRRQGDVITVIDLGSSNGTLVNGNEIHDATPLKEGDVLTIGDQELRFYMEAEVAEPVPVAVSSVNDWAPAAPPSPSPVYGWSQEPTPAPFVAETPAWNPAPSWTPTPPIPPAPPTNDVAGNDVAALLEQTQRLLEDARRQLAAGGSNERILGAVRNAVAQIDTLLAGVQHTVISDLHDVAHTTTTNRDFEQVAAFARRASEIRDALAAYAHLVDGLSTLRQQLQSALS